MHNFLCFPGASARTRGPAGRSESFAARVLALRFPRGALVLWFAGAQDLAELRAFLFALRAYTLEASERRAGPVSWLLRKLT